MLRACFVITEKIKNWIKSNKNKKKCIVFFGGGVGKNGREKTSMGFILAYLESR